ncbi:MAG TPA: FGGY family carbohydrate kinase, partial [Chthoniobacterales bacterium]|nr:FGGY family carbohydrate kinase [Chthoniobacterales bacterium]
MLCLGFDSGTTTCKGLVLDADSGKVLTQASAPHSFIEGLPRGHVEQDPQIWPDAAERVIFTCLEKIGERRSELVAFGVSAQQHGLVTLDDRNQPVRPAKLWCDTSTAEQSDKL